MQFVRPIKFAEAIKKIGDKTPLGTTLNSSEWSQVPVAIRERAFFSSTVESVRFLQRARNQIEDFLAANRETLPDGTTMLKMGSRAQFAKEMSAFAVNEGIGPVDPKDKGTIKDITSEKRLGLIFDVQIRQSQDYGYWKQGQDPDVLNEFPAQRFIRVIDVEHARSDHSQYEGQVRLKSDIEFWIGINKDFGVPWGPWGWGCGHDVEDVDRDEAESLGLIQPGEKVQPVEKDLNERLEASTARLDDDLSEQLLKQLGNKVVLDGDRLKWIDKAQAKASEALPYSDAWWAKLAQCQALLLQAEQAATKVKALSAILYGS